MLIDSIVSFCSFTFNILWMNIRAQTKNAYILFRICCCANNRNFNWSWSWREIVCFQFIRRMYWVKYCFWSRVNDENFMDTERRIVCIWTWCALNFLLFEHTEDTFSSESMCCIKEHNKIVTIISSIILCFFKPQKLRWCQFNCRVSFQRI